MHRNNVYVRNLLAICDIAWLLSTPPCFHVAISEMWCWSGGRETLRKKAVSVSVLCTIIMVHSGISSSYRLVDWILLITLGLTLLYRQSLWCLQLFHSLLYLLVSWAWWDWPLTWLNNHCPSVLWHCWLGRLTHKIVPKMTYNVSSGTLKPCYTISYQTVEQLTLIAVLMFVTVQYNVWW